MRHDFADQASTASAVEKPGFGNELDSFTKRLGRLYSQLEDINQRLTGPVPEAASATEPNRPIVSIGSRLSDIGHLLNRVEHAVERIGQVL